MKRILWAGLFQIFWSCTVAQAALPVVNGVAMTPADLHLLAALQNREVATAEAELADEWINRELIRGFLAKQKIVPDAEDLAWQRSQLNELVQRRGKDPALFWQELKIAPDRIDRELSLSLAWLNYVKATITPEQIRAHFDQHRLEFDGTRVRARQIFFKRQAGETDADLASRVQKMAEIRQQIQSQALDFPTAAQRFSEAPSKKDGGDVGWFAARGRMPYEVAKVALPLNVGELSEPILSPFGVHLVLVEEKEAGLLSPEDARRAILDQLSTQLWEQTVQQQRQTAKIQR